MKYQVFTAEKYIKNACNKNDADLPTFSGAIHKCFALPLYWLVLYFSVPTVARCFFTGSILASYLFASAACTLLSAISKGKQLL